MKKKILFIVNPISGTGRQKTVEPLLKKYLDKGLFDYEIAYTKAAKHAIELSKQAVIENFDIVTAVGGDGSVNEVGRSLINTNTTLSILPCGSGNGLARNLNLSANFIRDIKTINRLKIKTIDTFTANNEPVLNVFGIGFAAYISHEFDKLHKRGFANYIKLAMQNAIQYQPQTCKITLDDSVIDEKIFLVDIANGKQWGNDTTIAPAALNDDGWLDLCILKNFPRIQLPIIAARLFLKNINTSKYMKTIRIKEVVLQQENSYVHIDGEPYLMEKEIKIKINPLSLKVITG